ncbi:hypothetical protein PMAYCL1PPCAC_04725 [Pristionchus mayeri]|uniref:Uncharacterized protein n=1 Tax=Pristionchus mayeri TaxID=1317129 RepID=A0AAN4ZCN8_9BILA|nr:hypothetical protein PMAYCL1PPCAC_04725 [Pristionchus mayeri]
MKRLFVQWKGREIDVGVPGDLFDFDNENCHIGVFGNAIYFATRDAKIYKVTFSSTIGMTVSYRHLLSDEMLHPGGLCERDINGEKYLYRMCDNSETNVIVIDLPDQDLFKITFAGIYRSAYVNDS